MTADPAKFSQDRRDRLGAAILGAVGSELVTVRAADLRACLGLTDAIEDAQRLIGENARLQREADLGQARAVQVTVLTDKLAAAEGQIEALKARQQLAAKILRGEP